MALNGVISSGLTAIATNSAAMRVTSDNIANVNTPGYVRRVAQQSTLAPGGQLAGVQLSEVQRIVNAYLDKEVLTSNGNASRYTVQSSMMDQLNASLGEPGDGSSIGSRLDAVYAALGQSALDPSSLANRLGALNRFNGLAQEISNLAGSISDMRTAADQQIGSVVSEANIVIKKITDLNPLIQHATIAGDTGSGLLDQRDTLVSQLSSLIGIRTLTQADGRMFISTTDGVQLVSDNYAVLKFQPSSGPSFKPVMVQTMNRISNQPVGSQQILEPHVSNGELRGLLDMRDETLSGLGQELGSLAQTLSSAFNAVHNANAAIPPPGLLQGRNTGLLGTDALNFTGATTIAIADGSGVKQHDIAIDFDAGTLSVDGGPTAGLGASVDSFVLALNTALGSNGSASFVDGALKLSATGGNGFVIADDSANPTSRGGVAFSQYFGLNDLFTSSGNTVLTTGLTASDSHGLSGGSISLVLKGPEGQRAGETTVAVTGATVGDVISALNTAMAGKANFALDANGEVQVTTGLGYSGYDLEITADTTMRGTTGQSFTSLFGIGVGNKLAMAQNFSLASGVANAPQRLAFSKPTITATAVVTAGDNRGLLALQDAMTQTHNFASAGDLPGRSVRLSDFTAAFYQDAASRGSSINAAQSAGDTRLKLAQQSQSEKEGVNLDEELAKMMSLQQAYNAGARLLVVAQQLYDALLQVVGA